MNLLAHIVSAKNFQHWPLSSRKVATLFLPTTLPSGLKMISP